MPSNNNGFRERLTFAFFRWQALHRQQLQQGELGRLVGRGLGGEPVGQSAVSRWFTESVPDLRTVQALARVLEVDPGWLAFGKDSAAPMPTDPAMPSPMPRPKR